MRKYSAALADLRFDIAGALPTEAIIQWNVGHQSFEKHEKLLSPYLRKGVLLSSDSSGLSKLTQKYTLAQVMKLVSEPKEKIHALGKAIGGQAVGVWAADNTQMFFDDSIPASHVLQQMLAFQAEKETLPLQVGIGMHYAETYHIGGGLYGAEADLIEEITENESDGGELLFTQEFAESCDMDLVKDAKQRVDLGDHGMFLSITDGPKLAPLKTSDDIHYPTPFDRGFFETLRSSSLEDLETLSFSRYSMDRAVVVLWIPHEEKGPLLEKFTRYLQVQSLVQEAADDFGGDVVKSSGSLGIVLFEDALQSLSYARTLQRTMAAHNFPLHVGIAYGEVFVFPLDDGGRDIAGNPLNIASKLSEDSGMHGILLHSSLLYREPALRLLGSGFELSISGIPLTGVTC